MNIIDIRGHKIGDGVTKICAPITGVTKESIIEQAFQIKKSGADMAEWRADWYQDVDYYD